MHPCKLRPHVHLSFGVIDIRNDDALFMSETHEPAGMLVHVLDPHSGDLTTHVQYTDTYAEVEALKGYVEEHREELRGQYKGLFRKTHGREYGDDGKR